MNIYDITKKIQELRNDYFDKYMKNAKYCKIPLWAYQYMKQNLSTILKPAKYGDELFGLKLCPTLSITEIEDIEVF